MRRTRLGNEDRPSRRGKEDRHSRRGGESGSGGKESRLFLVLVRLSGADLEGGLCGPLLDFPRSRGLRPLATPQLALQGPGRALVVDCQPR